MTTQIKKCSGTNVYVIPEMLSGEQCDYLIKYFSTLNKTQILEDIPEISNALWHYIGNKLSGIDFVDGRLGKTFNIIGIKPAITFSKAGFVFGRHIDRQLGGDAFKMLFYLNKLSAGGGTDFYEPYSDDGVYAENNIGTGVLFDIGIEHSSQPFPSGEIKYVIGVRPIINYIQ